MPRIAAGTAAGLSESSRASQPVGHGIDLASRAAQAIGISAARKDLVDCAVLVDDPRILAQNGLRPSEGNPQCHQQMVYAVTMTTIDRFERALGRKAFWADRYDKNA